MITRTQKKRGNSFLTILASEQKKTCRKNKSNEFG